jgi:ribosomal-protein-alanine N-acetyltransferase
MNGVSLVIAGDCRTGETVGFSLSRSVADEAELLLLGVLPSRHREGVGGRLLEDFIDRARGRGAARVHLEVRDGNPAVGMYQSAGFQAVGRRRNYYRAPDGRRLDALTLAQDL